MSEIVEEFYVQQRSSIAVAERGLFVAHKEEEKEEKQIQGKDGGKRRIGIRKAKKMVLYPFKRINSLYSSNTDTSNNQCTPPSASASSSYSVVSSSSSSKFSLGSSSKYPYYYGERPIARCYLCFMEPPVEDDSPPVVSGKKENNPNISSYDSNGHNYFTSHALKTAKNHFLHYSDWRFCISLVWRRGCRSTTMHMI